jgi:hypothetical protein
VTVTWTCPAATISYSLSSLCASSSTSLTVNRTGTAGGTYSATPAGLSINSTTGEINPSASIPGNYTVHYQIASGGNGCTALDATANVTINGTPIASVTGQSNINCFAANDGTITITASNGTAPYAYSIDNGANYTPSASNPFTFTGLQANVAYKIRVKDNTGCESRFVQ